MLAVALTGGVGSGKSTVAAILAGFGVPIIDADEIAHALTSPGNPVLVLIAEAPCRTSSSVSRPRATSPS